MTARITKAEIELLRQVAIDLKPFDLKPIGAPNSEMRAEQNQKIETHKALLKLIARLEKNHG